jgi:hypothetical protein
MNQRLNIDIVANDKSKQALSELDKNLGKVKSSIFNLKNAFLGIGAGVVIKGFFDAGVQIENLGVQLNALFKSAEKGKQALDIVTKFAAGTPFELKNIQQGITALATVSKTAEESGVSFEELLKITGNTAVILGGDFALASLQIQRSFSAGISSAELFRERGVKAMAGFKEGVSINSKQSIEGLRKAFGTGGEYGKLMNDLSQTTFGILSNLKDAFFLFQVEVSKGFFGALKKNLGDLYNTVENNTKAINEFGSIVGTGLSKAINATASAVKFLKDNMKILIESIKILIAFKLITFFYNLSVAIKSAFTAMLLFNGAVKRNLIIAGGAILASQLDKIIKKIKELRGITDGDIDTEPEEKIGTTISKNIPKSTFMDKLILQGEIFKTMIIDLNASALDEMKKKFFTIGEIIANSINKGIKNISKSIAESVILGNDLAETFRKMAQQLLVNILAHFIEMTARLLIDIALQKIKTQEMKSQESSLKRQIALQAVLMAMGGGGGGGGGFLSGLFRASGGSVRKGQPYVVGEQGAELFIPNQTGQITQSARGTGGGETNVNFTINATDVRGIKELLINNRSTIVNVINSALNEKGKEALV